MSRKLKRFAPIALFVATLCVFGNIAHSLEHDIGVGFGQNHAECSHCSIDVGSDAQTGQTAFSLQRDVFVSRWVSSGFLPSFTAPLRARAPPLS